MTALIALLDSVGDVDVGMDLTELIMSSAILSNSLENKYDDGLDTRF